MLGVEWYGIAELGQGRRFVDHARGRQRKPQVRVVVVRVAPVDPDPTCYPVARAIDVAKMPGVQNGIIRPWPRLPGLPTQANCLTLDYERDQARDHRGIERQRIGRWSLDSSGALGFLP